MIGATLFGKVSDQADRIGSREPPGHRSDQVVACRSRANHNPFAAVCSGPDGARRKVVRRTDGHTIQCCSSQQMFRISQRRNSDKGSRSWSI